MPRKKKIYVEDVLPLVEEYEGNLSAIARELNVGRSTVQRRVNESKKLQDAVESARERSLDKAEKQLEEKIEEGNLSAIIFKLKTQGKNRGYTQRQEFTGKQGEPIKTESKSKVDFDVEGQAEEVLKALEAKRERERANKESSE